MKRALKWVGAALGILIIIVLILAAIGVIRTQVHLNRVWKVEPAGVLLPTDPASLAEGKRLYSARGCAGCHGEDAGGMTVIDDPAVGRFDGPNLTSGQGGVTAGLCVVDWVRVIREGVKHNGHLAVLMPADELNHLSDREVGEIVAYLKTVPPVNRTMSPPRFGPVVYFAYGLLSQFPLLQGEKVDHNAPRPPEPQPGLTVAFGNHLASVQCKGCHGETLSGGPLPGAPPSMPVPQNITPDLTTGLGKWTLAQFRTLLRTGKRPDGSEVNPFMPWSTYRHLSDDEIAALWLYLQSLPAKPFGHR